LEVTEKIILGQIKDSNKIAFENIFKMYYAQLCSFANTFVQDLDEAEEIVQELFFQFWQKRENIQIEISIKSYLYKATRNACLNFLKHQNIKNIYSESYKFENSEYFSDDYNSIETNELSENIRITIEKLPSERKKIFLLVRFKNLKYKEVAEELKISIKTVENQMGSALKFLRSELKDFIPILIFVGMYFFEKYFKF